VRLNEAPACRPERLALGYRSTVEAALLKQPSTHNAGRNCPAIADQTERLAKVRALICEGHRVAQCDEVRTEAEPEDHASPWAKAGTMTALP
jgi:hypothetical protein